MAITIRHHRTAMAHANYLKGQQFDSVPGRLVEVFSLPAALSRRSTVTTKRRRTAIWGKILEEWDFGGQQTKDEVRLLEIMTAEVSLDKGSECRCRKLLAEWAIEARSAAQRVGLARSSNALSVD